LESIEPSS